MTKKQVIVGLLLILALVIFLNQEFFLTTLPKKIFGKNRFDSHRLTIVVSSPVDDLSPYHLDLDTRLRTANVYEGLMSFDPTLKIVPALAVSWGNIDPVTWEFKLRRDVLFHDGKILGTQDVIDSFEAAKKEGGAEMQTLLNTIDTIKATGPDTLRITTHAPDPLILSKLTSFMITHPENVGTGPYRFDPSTNKNDTVLTAFVDYWGPLPKFKNAEYRVTEDRWKRSGDFTKGETDILTAVPAEEAVKLGDKIKKNYSLEVSFLMFNLQDELLKDPDLRQKMQTLFDPKKIEGIGNHFVRPVSQFIAPGVFGYNDQIAPLAFDPGKKALSIFGDKRKKISLDYPETYKTLVEYIDEQLRQAGFSVELNPLPAQQLLDRIRSNQSQLFVLGWQSENGDAGDFLNAFIQSNGEFNHGRYSNPDVDRLIQQSQTEIDPQKRLTLLQQVMEKVNADRIGIPLFESTRLYAVRPGISWEPRLDGLVLAKEVK